MISEAFFYKEEQNEFLQNKQESKQGSDEEYRGVLEIDIFVFWKGRIK